MDQQELLWSPPRALPASSAWNGPGLLHPRIGWPHNLHAHTPIDSTPHLEQAGILLKAAHGSLLSVSLLINYKVSSHTSSAMPTVRQRLTSSSISTSPNQVNYLVLSSFPDCFRIITKALHQHIVRPFRASWLVLLPPYSHLRQQNPGATRYKGLLRLAIL